MTTRASIDSPNQFLDAEINDVRTSIDRTLGGYLAETREEFSQLEPATAPIVEELQRMVAAGGRRFRPILCYLAHLACGGLASEKILRAAGSLELLHTFALLHDDVMDRPQRRRGQPALLIRAAADHLSGARPANPEQFGVSLSVLAGDLAFVLSDSLFWSSGFPAKLLAAASVPLHGLRVQAVAGQYLDLVAPPIPEPAAARRIATLKTAAYTVGGPLAIGAALAGARAEAEEALESFGAALGLAFGLQDDLLGVFGDEALTGKDATSDLRQGKPTVLIAEANQRADGDGRETITAIWGSPSPTARQVEELRLVIEASGAPEVLIGEISDLVADSKRSLDEAKFLQTKAIALLNRLADLASAPVWEARPKGKKTQDGRGREAER